MSNQKLKNPFPFVGYYGPDYFCDRGKEMNQIIRNLENGGSITLISIRRMGKTGLIHHVFGNLPVGFKGIYLDILATENLNQLLNNLATAIIRSMPENSSIGKKVWIFIKSLRPVITFDSLTGEPQASFNIIKEEINSNIESVFQFLEQQSFKTVIALDEFQQILNYPEKSTEAWLRGAMQQLKQVYFIFSGSQQHLMADMFAFPNRPFFRSAQLLFLHPIEAVVYAKFIEKLFQQDGKIISPEITNDILKWCNLHTYYVQLLCNRIFSATKKEVSAEIWKTQANELLREQEPVFFNYRNVLTNHQWQLLKALALENRVYQPTSKEFITVNHLGSSATVLRSLGSLLKYEFAFSSTDDDGHKYYSVYDVLFKNWIRDSIF